MEFRGIFQRPWACSRRSLGPIRRLGSSPVRGLCVLVGPPSSRRRCFAASPQGPRRAVHRTVAREGGGHGAWPLAHSGAGCSPVADSAKDSAKEGPRACARVTPGGRLAALPFRFSFFPFGGLFFFSNDFFSFHSDSPPVSLWASKLPRPARRQGAMAETGSPPRSGRPHSNLSPGDPAESEMRQGDPGESGSPPLDRVTPRCREARRCGQTPRAPRVEPPPSEPVSHIPPRLAHGDVAPPPPTVPRPAPPAPGDGARSESARTVGTRRPTISHQPASASHRT